METAEIFQVKKCRYAPDRLHFQQVDKFLIIADSKTPIVIIPNIFQY